MKNIYRLSATAAVALLVTSSSLSGSDNLNDAFKNGKFQGELKAFYSSSNFLGKKTTDEIGVVGGSLNYTTADFYGFSSGVTFQASSVVFEDDNNKVFSNGTIPNHTDFDASGSVLSEAFLNYKISNTNLKVGRQFIATPLVATAIDGKSSQRVIKDSFEAYILTNTDIKDTTVVAGYVDKYQSSTNSAKDEGEFVDFQDGAYTLYVKNKSLEDLTIQAQYLDVDGLTPTNDSSNIYFDAEYNINGTTIAAQYLSSNDKSQSSGKEDGQAFGIKLQGGVAGLGYLLAYSSSTKDGDLNLGAGEGKYDTLFTSMPVNGGGVPARANTDTLVGGIVVPTKLVTSVVYAGKSMCDVGLGDVDAYGAMAIVPVNESLLLKANYEYVKSENTISAIGIDQEETNVVRVYLNYKF